MNRFKPTFFSLFLLLALAVSFSIQIIYQKNNALPGQLINRPVQVIGKISSIPQSKISSTHFSLVTKRINNKPLRKKLQLSWYQPYPHLHAGEVWRLSVKLKPIHSSHNPGGFDYQRWLFIHRFSATGYIRKSKNNQLVQAQQHWSLDYFRQKMIFEIQAATTDKNSRGILVALSTGSHAYIQDDQWAVLQRTGTNHLIAIAGLHLGLVASIAFLLMSFAWRRSLTLSSLIATQQLSFIAVLFASLSYTYLSGFSLPTLRASLSILLILLMRLTYKKLPVWRQLLSVFFCVILFDPMLLASNSLWLSFGSIAWIHFVLAGRLRQNKKWLSILKIQLALTVGLLSITFYFFSSTATLGIIANAIAIPWVSFLILPLCLLSTLFSLFSYHSAVLLFSLASKICIPLWQVLLFLSQLSFATINNPIHSFIALISGLIGSVILLAPICIRGKGFALFFFLPLFFQPLQKIKIGSVKLTVLDVGQGLASVIQTAHHVLIYDAGPKFYSGFDAGKSVVIPYLQYMNIKHISGMIISHGDNDHIGGAAAVLTHYPTRFILSSIPQKLHSPYARHCYQDQHWRWDQVSFQILNPKKDAAYEDNNSSCVLKITTHGHGILLTGDIERPAEDSMLKERLNLQSDIIVVPHHGSITSSSLPFLVKVKPKLAIISAGFENRYHFPNPIILKRYKSLSTNVLNTARLGAITLLLKSDGRIRTVYKH